MKVRDLVKVFQDEGRGQLTAVADVSFECYSGEIFGLLGTNGAGKTTTLRMLSTLLKPTSGEASVMGHEVTSQSQQVRRSIGYLSTTTALYPRLSCRETLDFFARINGYPESKIEERVNHLVDRFGLSDYADARIERLSTGMTQKVAIARTVAHDPPVVILDEPTNGLDILNVLDFHKLMRELQAAGKTVLFSTHTMSEAEKLCDRIAVIHRGRILACGTLDELRERSGHRYLEDIFVWLLDQHGEEAGPELETM
ncbi:MAG TPA: ABC transporter ATP-binding protein [Phycisphaerales bacterium]|nr:ABC transporter ATP-binding protein [Phycisphaerales bacterium]